MRSTIGHPGGLRRLTGTLLAALPVAPHFPGAAPAPRQLPYRAHDHTSAPLGRAQDAALSRPVESTYAPCASPQRTGGAHDLRTTRDRHRAAAGTPADGLSRSALPGDTAPAVRAAAEPVPPSGSPHASRSADAHRPAALQVRRR